MKVLSIGSDKNLFDTGSDVHKRAQAYAKRLGELHVVVFTLRTQGYKESHAHELHVYPTNSLSKIFYIFDAGRIARELESDVITVQDPFEAGFAGVLGQKGRPLHVQLHTDPFSSYFAKSLLNRLRLIIAAIVFKRAARVRVVSARVKEKLQEKYPDLPVSNLPVFVDTAAARELPRAVHPRFKLVLLWVGRFEKEKNPILALKVLATISKAYPDCGLIMLGTGTLGRALKEHARKLEIKERVEFPGWKNPAPYLSMTDLLLVTSRFEGYGRQIIEALAAGVPVLSTDVGVAREAGAILTHENEFKNSLQDWIENGERKGELQNYPYQDFREYVEKYCSDIEKVAKTGNFSQ